MEDLRFNGLSDAEIISYLMKIADIDPGDVGMREALSTLGRNQLIEAVEWNEQVHGRYAEELILH